MNQESNRADGKRPYKAPRLTTISLRPEEAVLGNCKTSGTGGPVQPTCTFISACRVPGS
jgi:hypothetical protein